MSRPNPGADSTQGPQRRPPVVARRRLLGKPVVELRDAARTAGWRPRPRAGLGLAVILLAGCTLAALRLGAVGFTTLPTMALIYLVVVVIAAIVGGIWTGIATAAASDALLNWYFIPPYRTLAVEHRDNLVALVVYVLAAATVSVLLNLAAEQRTAAVRSGLEARLLAQKAAELAEVDRLRTAILRAVGHDLRTPLAAITAAASSLQNAEVEFSPDDRAELVATVVESANRLDALVENLLALSRLQAGVLSANPRPVALDEIVATAALGFPAEAMAIDVADDLPLVMADPGLLDRVLANLIDNAMHATGGGPVLLRATVVAEVIELAVVDSGPGIPEHERERLFAPFQRMDDHSAAGRLGLGLAIARGFTEAMGGRLIPSATQGGGLTMTIELGIA